MKLIYSQDVINLIEKSPINGWVKDTLIDDIKELPDLGNCKNCKIMEYVFMQMTDAKLLSAQSKSEHTMEEFMYGQDLGSPEDGSL